MSKYKNAEVRRLRSELTEATQDWGRGIANELPLAHPDLMEVRIDRMIAAEDALCKALDQALFRQAVERRKSRQRG